MDWWVGEAVDVEELMMLMAVVVVEGMVLWGEATVQHDREFGLSYGSGCYLLGSRVEWLWQAIVQCLWREEGT